MFIGKFTLIPMYSKYYNEYFIISIKYKVPIGIIAIVVSYPIKLNAYKYIILITI